ncbi:MAG: class I SAM-dependent methyltransferase [Sedimentisphaerales bacterium]|nr:class I SAM-dependent methyltransferase [Sedimentisphaerales bacterium]
MRNKAMQWLNWARDLELEALKQWLLPMAEKKARLLEIGGGNGYLAKCLTEMGFDVVSIDPQPRQPGFYPVRTGDGSKLEFSDDSFDIIFSSNVMEHIENLPDALREMKRVLKSGGLMVHTMPTPFCTMLTILTQPIGYLMGLSLLYRRFRRRLFPGAKTVSSDNTIKGNGPSGNGCRKENIIEALRIINPFRIVVSPPHGTSPTCFAELRDWRPNVWCEKFEQADFQVREVIHLPLAYSRHMILPFHFIDIRKHLAKEGVTSCMAYILSKDDDTDTRS